MYDGLVKELRGEYGYDTRKYIRVMKAAADVIEKLSERVRELEYDPTCDPEWRDCHDLGD